MYIILRLRNHVPCEHTDTKPTIGSNSVRIDSWATNTRFSSHPTSASLCTLDYGASLLFMSYADDLEIRMFYHMFTFFWCLYTPFTCSQVSFTWLDRNVLHVARTAYDQLSVFRRTIAVLKAINADPSLSALSNIAAHRISAAARGLCHARSSINPGVVSSWLVWLWHLDGNEKPLEPVSAPEGLPEPTAKLTMIVSGCLGLRVQNVLLILAGLIMAPWWRRVNVRTCFNVQCATREMFVDQPSKLTRLHTLASSFECLLPALSLVTTPIVGLHSMEHLDWTARAPIPWRCQAAYHQNNVSHNTNQVHRIDSTYLSYDTKPHHLFTTVFISALYSHIGRTTSNRFFIRTFLTEY